MKHGFFLGRMNPIHIGHEAVMNHMIKTCGEGNYTVILGSANAPTSMRQFFSYTERRDFVRQLYPKIRIVGIPDYPDNDEWLAVLHDLIQAITGKNNSIDVQFFGGEDDYVSQLLTGAGYPYTIVNRFDGTTPVVSATEVRNHLLHDRPLDGLLNPAIASSVHTLFHARWQEFIKQ